MRSFWCLGLVSLFFALSCTTRVDDGDQMVMRVAYKDDVKTFDPAIAYDHVSWDILPSVWEQLYQFAYLETPFQIEPLLAADMPKYSSDRLTVTIRIRKDVRYQNDPAFPNGKGRGIKASDFIFAFKRLALPLLQSPGFWIFDGKIKGFSEFQKKVQSATGENLKKAFDQPIEGLQAIDDHTLQIKLIRPYPQLLYVLATPFTSPVPPEAIAAYGDEKGAIHLHPVGTGPFRLKKWQRGHIIVLERNKEYHPSFFPTEGHSKFKALGFLADAGKPLPFLDRIEMAVIKEEQPRWLNFLKGKLDRLSIPKDSFQQAILNQVNLSPELKDKGIRLTIETGSTFRYVVFNLKDEILGKNKYLRQAISSAIDRERFIRLFFQGRGQKMTSPLPPGIAGRPQDPVLKYDYNLDRAKELLKKAGYPNGKNLPEIRMDFRQADSVHRQMGEFFAAELAKIGVRLKVIFNTFPAYLEKEKQGNIQIALTGWTLDYPDAENVYQLFYGPNKAPGPNASNWDDPKVNRLYEKMAIMSDGPSRANLIQQLDRIIQEECPWALLFYRADFRLSQPWLKNYRGSEMLINEFKYYRIDRSASSDKSK